MKNLFSVLLLVSGVFLLSLPAFGTPQGPARISFAGQSAGLVDFSHDLHKEYVPQCETCHHMGVGTGTCVDCHGVDSRARGKNQAFHQSCQGCHLQRNVAKPGNCQFCHTSTDNQNQNSRGGKGPKK